MHQQMHNFHNISPMLLYCNNHPPYTAWRQPHRSIGVPTCGPGSRWRPSSPEPRDQGATGTHSCTRNMIVAMTFLCACPLRILQRSVATFHYNGLSTFNETQRTCSKAVFRGIVDTRVKFELSKIPSECLFANWIVWAPIIFRFLHYFEKKLEQIELFSQHEL